MNEIHFGPFSSQDYVVENEWQGPSPDNDAMWLVVYAGEEIMDSGSTAGLPSIRAFQMATDPNDAKGQTVSLGTHTYGQAPGVLTIKSTDGNVYSAP